MKDNNATKRMIIALALSLAFLIPYMYFFAPSPKTNVSATSSKNAASTENIAIDEGSTIKSDKAIGGLVTAEGGG